MSITNDTVTGYNLKDLFYMLSNTETLVIPTSCLYTNPTYGIEMDDLDTLAKLSELNVFGDDTKIHILIEPKIDRACQLHILSDKQDTPLNYGQIKMIVKHFDPIYLHSYSRTEFLFLIRNDIDGYPHFSSFYKHVLQYYEV